jgi:glyoxylase-like metal-dependent hydrolase (beta-lactamase superfamily II)
LLVDGATRVLVDVGCGEKLAEKYGQKFADKFTDIYKLDRTKNSIEKSLAVHGVGFADITHVILTHLHFDHAGGATIWSEGKLRPTFPKAKYFVQRRNLETAKNPNVREKASYFKENFEPLLEAGCLTLLDGDGAEILPDISVRSTFGHTEAQQLVRVGTQKPGDCIIYGGDIIPTSSHIKLPFVMGYDLQPLVIIEEKRKILTELAAQDGVIFFEHDPKIAAARVKAEGSDFVLKEAVTL